jgi:RNA polymerase sigma factor (TIGR02999 family)
MDPATVARLLRQWRDGDARAEGELFDAVYGQLRGLARACLSGERPGDTLPAAVLVHETYLRLAGSDFAWQDRAHLFAVAARMMRRILVDHARARVAKKREGMNKALSLDEALVVCSEPNADMLILDEALQRLTRIHARGAQALELFYFGGLTCMEAAEVLEVSEATIERDLRFAKAWLHRELSDST